MPKVKCMDCKYHKPWVTNKFKGWCDNPRLGQHSVGNRYSLRRCLLFALKEEGGKDHA